ncbi:MAG: ThiF family adenylyltransferase [Candidatus Freyarchaeota archaeon]|nr:ThiF family adenylyltransferase [Candidatus Jordarchaeia archaeon]MBS7270411.1 ThiF family adenylyltransferase [Candidatus Jordarchaeia archaeon]MBS7280563.1 ThiF family adenylyltransferase [Candidatus Jordarchaeia archaeon]
MEGRCDVSVPVKSVVFFNFSPESIKTCGSGFLFGKVLDGDVLHIHSVSSDYNHSVSSDSLDGDVPHIHSVGSDSDGWRFLGRFRFLSNLLVLAFKGCIGILRYCGNNLRDAYVLHGDAVERFWEALSRDETRTFFEEKSEGVEKLFVDFVSESNIFSRIRGIVDTDLLKEKRVTVVGLGTGGSRVALELAKAGVGNFTLIDHDRLETHNISRYVKGVSDLGRLKVNVVADLLLDVNPKIRVSKYPIRIGIDKNIDEFSEIVSSSDVVVDATGSPLVNQFVNSTCWRLNIPSVYAGAFERAIGLYVLKVQPPHTPCYNCVFEKIFSQYTPPKPEFVDYTQVSDPSELRAEPGLSISVGFGALLQAWYALQILLGEKGKIGLIEHQMIIWGNKKEWIFEKEDIPSIMFATIERNEECPVCRGNKWIKRAKKEIKITDEELERKLTRKEKKLLEEIFKQLIREIFKQKEG